MRSGCRYPFSSAGDCQAPEKSEIESRMTLAAEHAVFRLYAAQRGAPVSLFTFFPGHKGLQHEAQMQKNASLNAIEHTIDLPLGYLPHSLLFFLSSLCV